jgi:hypothetical protein
MTSVSRKVAVLIAVACLLLVGGCGGSGADKQKDSDARWSTSKAQTEYLDIVAAVNEPRARFNYYLSTHPDSKDIPVFNAKCREMNRAVQESIQRFESGKWPKVAQPAVTDLISTAKSEQAAWEDCSQATTMKQVRTAMQVPGAGESGQKAAAVRTALGLPASTGSPSAD